jgi:hypothetical protein
LSTVVGEKGNRTAALLQLARQLDRVEAGQDELLSKQDELLLRTKAIQADLAAMKQFGRDVNTINAGLAALDSKIAKGYAKLDENAQKLMDGMQEQIKLVADGVDTVLSEARAEKCHVTAAQESVANQLASLAAKMVHASPDSKDNQLLRAVQRSLSELQVRCFGSATALPATSDVLGCRAPS